MASPQMTEDLKLSIKHQLKSLGVNGTIENVLRELQLQQAGSITPNQALELLQAKGILSQLAKSITAPAPSQISSSPYLPISVPSPPPTSDGQSFLQIKVLGGTAFTDYLTRVPYPGEQLCLSLECFGQRLDVAPVPACTEPAFRGEVFLEIPRPKPSQPQHPSHAAAGQATGTSSSPSTSPPNHHTNKTNPQNTVLGGGGALAGGPEVSASLQLLSLRQPIHIAVTSATPSPAQLSSQQQGVEHSMAQQGQLSTSEQAAVDQSCLQRAVIGMGLGEWRTVLLRRRPVVVSVQLSSGPGVALGMPAGATMVGVLQLQLALHPKTDVALDEPLLALQQRSESARDAEAAAGFITRARAWWADYVRLNMHEFKHRPVKVLARGEDGALVPTPTFVRPLQLGRLLPTPRHAARMVALLRPRDEDAHAAAGLTGRVGGVDTGVSGGESYEAGSIESRAAAAAAGTECWCTLHTMLFSHSGSQEEQAVLLCSLLLGFGLDAYVCVGRLRSGAGHMWVVTRGPFFTTKHWEPSNGTHYSSLQGPEACPYLSVGSMFNHHSIWANCQADDDAATASYVLEDGHQWQELRVGVHDRPGFAWSTLPLARPRVDTLALEVWLEERVKEGLQLCRAQQLLGRETLSQEEAEASCCMPWDSQLEHLLMPALEAYEHEALTGEAAPGNEEFQTAIKRNTPLGMVFKGVPLHHRSLGPADIVSALLADQQVQALLNIQDKGVSTSYALRARIFAYPEDLFSVWVMLCARHKGSAAV